MTQNLKKETCNGICQNCRVLNLAQRRIGERTVVDTNTIKGIARNLQEERCPVESQMKIELLNPANISRKQRRNILTWC